MSTSSAVGEEAPPPTSMPRAVSAPVVPVVSPPRAAAWAACRRNQASLSMLPCCTTEAEPVPALQPLVASAPTSTAGVCGASGAICLAAFHWLESSTASSCRQQ